MPGFMMVSGWCEPENGSSGCPMHCSTCTSSGDCTACEAGFDLMNGMCVDPNCPANCMECTSDGMCTVCFEGYY